ncbi:NUDIX domain-containing protein [Nocardioides sp. R-C-SC26]|uniref:NUDIX domain-containing protein n=1 Tax=Nocardioides sp. R-C-SC26 TaxID=2870414 RepID=UPI001E465F11|nr:NUDIX hydrolase [Nocardioides sp. R-C-SC26]
MTDVEIDGAPEPLRDVIQRWPVRSTRDIHRDDWVVALRADDVEAPDGTPLEHERLVVEHPGAVIVLALDDDDRVFCLWQYRHAAQRRFVELPAGLMDAGPDETPLDVARRELREEAQLQAVDWTALGSTYPSPGIISEIHHLFVARGLSPCSRGDFVLENEEADMSTGWVPFADLYAAVLAGEVADGPVVQCVLLAVAKGLVRQ